METIKQINIKNGTCYFYNGIIDLENFDSSLLKLDKKSYKGIGFYNIAYLTIKKIGDCKDIKSVNPLYLGIDHARGYTEEENENKYIVFDYADKNNYIDAFNEIMDKINERYNNDYNYEKDYLKIRFSSDDHLPLNESLNFHN